MTRKPLVQKQINVGQKLHIELVKAAGAAGMTVEAYSVKALWAQLGMKL